MKPRAFRTLTLAILAALLAGGSGAVGSGARRVPGHVPVRSMARSRHLGRHAAQASVHVAVSLIPRDPGGLQELLQGLYDPADPRYHQFLTPEQFRQRFAPTDADVASLATSLRSRGLTISKVHENNLLIEADAPSGVMEQAFQVELHDYETTDGTVAFAPTSEPLLQGEGADKVMAVTGLSTFARRHTHQQYSRQLDAHASSINNYMTPAKIRTAYNTSAIGLTGSGETLALFELDGYAASDISTYATQFGISPAPTLQNVLVSDGTTTPTNTPGAGTGEVCLDIELAMALAPGLSKIMVYIAPNTDAGVIAAYNKIATDNAAKEVSTSWGLYEGGNLASTLNAEHTAFAQMASQGQSMFAAAGDSGAYDGGGTTLAVDDPASQPNVTGVGGTSLTVNVTTGAYGSETTWNNASGGGGGGVSAVWTQGAGQATYQANFATVANGGSATMRMVPDVSLDADPSTGYPVYYSGSWNLVGGTSAAAPLWAAFLAIVNQGSVANGLGRQGLINSKIYGFASSGSYTSLFHDVADGSTNKHYPAVTGYDLATGLGSLNGYNLYKAFVGAAAPATVTISSGATSITVGWSVVAGATSYKLYRATSATGPYTAVATGLSGLSYSDSTAIGTSYYYVAAVNAVAEGAGSTVVSGAIAQAAPAAPTGFTGAVQ